jgi:Ribbon-helix-helix protein, copG family
MGPQLEGVSMRKRGRGSPGTGHTPMIGLRVPEPVIEAIRKEASRLNVGYSAIVREALDMYLHKTVTAGHEDVA